MPGAKVEGSDILSHGSCASVSDSESLPAAARTGANKLIYPQPSEYFQSGDPTRQLPGPDAAGVPPIPPALPPNDPLVPANIGGWFNRIVGVIRRSLATLLVIQFGATLVGAALGITALQLTIRWTVSGSSAGPAVGLFLSTLLLMVAGVFAQGVSVYVAIRDAAGEPISVGSTLRFAADRVLPLLGWGIVAGVMTVIGFVVFILPGVYLAIVFSATLEGVVIVERRSIGRCFKLVKARFWPTAARMLLALLLGILYTAGVRGVISAAASQNSVTSILLQAILDIPLGLAAVGLAVVTYAELRFRESANVRTPTLAGELRQ